MGNGEWAKQAKQAKQGIGHWWCVLSCAILQISYFPNLSSLFPEALPDAFKNADIARHR